MNGLFNASAIVLDDFLSIFQTSKTQEADMKELELLKAQHDCTINVLEQTRRDLNRALEALEHLEQAYSNKHSPQHRAAALAHARAALGAK